MDLDRTQMSWTRLQHWLHLLTKQAEISQITQNTIPKKSITIITYVNFKNLISPIQKD